MYPSSVKKLPLAIQARAAMERRIVRSLVNEFAPQGFTFKVDDGGDKYIRCATVKQALKALINTDEDQLGIVKDGKVIGWIKLVYGNDGWDVMSDWHTNLDQYMPQTLALVEKLSQ